MTKISPIEPPDNGHKPETAVLAVIGRGVTLAERADLIIVIHSIRAAHRTLPINAAHATRKKKPSQPTTLGALVNLQTESPTPTKTPSPVSMRRKLLILAALLLAAVTAWQTSHHCHSVLLRKSDNTVYQKTRHPARELARFKPSFTCKTP
jgi:hypothetical protein